MTDLTIGCIYRSDKLRHPLIFLEHINDMEFKAVMLTHSSSKDYSDNIELKAEHFLTHDQSSKKLFNTQYDDTFYLSQVLIKKNDWGPYYQSGQLTKEGLDFILANLKPQPIYWRAYVNC